MPSPMSICRMASEAVMNRIDLAVLPPRERVSLEVEVDAAGGDQRGSVSAVGRFAPRRATARDSHRHAVRVVCVNDVGIEPSDQARETPPGPQVHLRSRRERISSSPSCARRRSSPSGCATSAARWRWHAALDGQQHLVLAATPAPAVSMCSENTEGFRLQTGPGARGTLPGYDAGRDWSCQSFANFRNT